MRTALYIIWGLIPLFFFLLALWTKLEQIGNKDKNKTTESSDTFKQGIFVLACVLVSIAIDHYFLEGFVDAVFPEFIPLGFAQVMLLPVVLYIGALVTGGSKPIKISKAPRPSERRKRRY